MWFLEDYLCKLSNFGDPHVFRHLTGIIMVT